MFTITLEEYPRRTRWMRGSVLKEMSLKEIISTPWKDEVKEIVKEWCRENFNAICKKIIIDDFLCISSHQSELRIMSFLRSMRMYDIRIIHLRQHKLYDQSYIRLKISFKRPSKKYYESMKILTRISIT